ncbi:MAG: HlyD family secretion protein, partial [Prevotellaceae bacterium]|nr:HlyD family secretion protein [Prevotellaceae bacterium]
VAGAGAALPFVRVQVSAQARGIVRTELENNQLQAAVYGEVADVRISENSQVTKGDTLVVLNAENIDVQIFRNSEKIKEDSLFINDIGALLANNFSSLRTPKYLYERNLYRSADNEQKTRINYLMHEFEVDKQLYQKEAIAQSEYLQTKNTYDNAVQSRRNTLEQFRNRWQAERTGYELEIRDLQASIAQLREEKSKYVVRAPVSGAVIQFSGIQRGSFIAPAQTFGAISNDSNLLAECYLSPADIGYIKENQQVKFQLDAFNYNQWGMAQGAVIEISKDIINADEQPVFRVRCSLNNKYLTLKNGYRGKLKKGMTLTARFYLTERTLWQLLFDKVDNWINPSTISK